ncbi:glycosyltransferase [Ancylobacter sp. TS-1]|uniref:glycosyltransferase n=1 Tax=Ancylobacter sp. TS-1 TaxID=1850374 RepID=UPI00139088EE|nr:glycosyltransferase [Ancylobacter sp. TS-1]
MFIDSSYTLSEIRERDLSHVLNIRLLDGYWDRVISAHPLDMRSTGAGAEARIGPTVVEEIDPHHSFVRGRFGRYAGLKRLSALNAFLALFGFWRTLVRLAKREGVDAVRAGDPLLCGLIGLCVARATGAKFVVRIPANNRMIRASTGEPMQPRFTRSIRVEERLEHLVISRADVVIAPSSDYADFAVSNGAKPGAIHLVRYGAMIDPRHLIPAADRPPPQVPGLEVRLAERPWMLHVGRLDRIKHIEDCFDVLETLAGDGSEAGLMLVGDGPMRAALEARSEKAGLANRTLFLGNLAQDQLFALLPTATVVLSPLTGRALAEAAYAACPIVAYDLDWQGDLILDGETGVLVPARDSAAMAAGAARLLDDPDHARAMGAAVRALAIDMLSPEAAYRTERAAYDALGIAP